MAAFEGELRQVILNLVLNSAQAVATRRAGEMAYEQGLIEVSTHHDHDRAVIIVRDDGCGMDEATRARIFDPFFTTKEFGQSTGQGLCLAYATIVGRHHGSIDVESTPGGGATFTVTLPLGGFDTAPSA
jgi:signal transduction histidine kinase